MSIETLGHISQLNDYAIINMDKIKERKPELFEESGAMNWEVFERDIRPNFFIYSRPSKNCITFQMQTGPIKEVGVNGCQVDILIHAARSIIDQLNLKFPCRENSLALTKLDEAIHWLDARTKDREARGVEGFNKD